jgi:enoyl-CoA hydratase
VASAVSYRPGEPVGEIHLDDGKVNAMGPAFFDAMNAALDAVERERPGALVFTGRPGMFSAGLDVKLLPTLPPDAVRQTLQTFGRTMLRIWTLGVPTVAAVGGHAVAGGVLLAFACDLRFAADGAFRLHMNEHLIDLAIPSWALAIAGAAIPPRWHNEALLHARAYSPAEAFERGMIDGVVPAERVVEHARAAATSLAPLGGHAYAATKRRMRAAAVERAERVLVDEMVMPGR